MRCAEWFIFELTRVGPDPGSNESQTFKKVSLQMLVYRTITSGHIFHKKMQHI